MLTPSDVFALTLHSFFGVRRTVYFSALMLWSCCCTQKCLWPTIGMILRVIKHRICFNNTFTQRHASCCSSSFSACSAHRHFPLTARCENLCKRNANSRKFERSQSAGSLESKSRFIDCSPLSLCATVEGLFPFQYEFQHQESLQLTQHGLGESLRQCWLGDWRLLFRWWLCCKGRSCCTTLCFFN